MHHQVLLHHRTSNTLQYQHRTPHCTSHKQHLTITQDAPYNGTNDTIQYHHTTPHNTISIPYQYCTIPYHTIPYIYKIPIPYHIRLFFSTPPPCQFGPTRQSPPHYNSDVLVLILILVPIIVLILVLVLILILILILL